MRCLILVVLMLTSALAVAQAACPPGTSWNGTSCALCSSGSSSSSSGASACSECVAGSFAATPGQVSCTDCPVGAYSSAVGATACYDCAPGSSSVNGSTACSLCAAGTFSNATTAPCEPCTAGSASYAAGATACVECQESSYSPSSGASVCTNCAAGSWNPFFGLTACINCSAGTYGVASQPSGSACFACPSATEPGMSTCPDGGVEGFPCRLDSECIASAGFFCVACVDLGYTCQSDLNCEREYPQHMDYTGMCIVNSDCFSNYCVYAQEECYPKPVSSSTADFSSPLPPPPLWPWIAASSHSGAASISEETRQSMPIIMILALSLLLG